MKFERSEIGALFSKLRTAVPEVRAVGNDSTGILLSGPDAFATNLELSIRAELSSPVPQGVVIPPRGVDFISGAVAPEININVTKSGLVIESGTARARLSTTPAENYPTFDGPGKDAKRCVVRANDLSWAISKVLYAVSKEDRHPAHKGLCFSHNGDDTLEICALDGYRMAISRIDCTADGNFKFVLPAATAKAIDTLCLDGSVSIERDRKKAVFSDNNFEVKSRLIAEPFLDYSKIVAQKSGGTRIVLDRKEWHYDVFSCKSSEKQVGSISSDYAQTGSFDLNDKATWSWHYIRKLGKLGAEAMMYEKFNGSGSTYVRAAFLSPSSAGVCAPWRGGHLVDGAACGLPCAVGSCGPGTAAWDGVPRLAGSGKKRG